MAIIKIINGHRPKIDDSCFLAENSIVTGNVTIGKNSSVWYQSVIRGDVNKIIIGSDVNIQDLSMIHGSLGRGNTIIGDRVSIGHKCIIHGCQIQSDVLIGMGSIILDDSLIESNVIVAAGSLVPANKILQSGFIYMGNPAKKWKEITPERAKQYINYTYQGYIGLSQLYKNSTEQ